MKFLFNNNDKKKIIILLSNRNRSKAVDEDIEEDITESTITKGFDLNSIIINSSLNICSGSSRIYIFFGSSWL